jgi:hypothetical protein
MSQNPLQQYFRQPKIYISLPSKGIYNKEGTINGDITAIPVFGMTGMDEIIARTPDSLLSGESSVRIIESCCPSIVDAWDLSVLDSELMFAAIKIATYGNTMSVTNTCKHCNAVNEYDLDLSVVINHFGACKYDNKIVINDLIIKTKPLTYKQFTMFNIKNFELQQKLSQAEKLVDKEKQQEIINELWLDLSNTQKELYITNIDSVQTPVQSVSELGFITEWIENCDKEVVDAIKLHLDKTRTAWNIPPYNVVCECGVEARIAVDLDYSNFFVNA